MLGVYFLDRYALSSRFAEAGMNDAVRAVCTRPNGRDMLRSSRHALGAQCLILKQQ